MAAPAIGAFRVEPLRCAVRMLASVLCVVMVGAGEMVGQTSATMTPKPAAVKAPPTEAQQMEHMKAQLADWPDLKRYQKDNADLPPVPAGEQRVVFMGDSITDGWGRLTDTGTFFPGKPYVNRGISGQTTPQMLVRFQQDVVHLKPAVVVILGGTNDIAGNTGPSTPEMTEDNFTSMGEIATSNGIKVVMASITPAYRYPWKPGVEPVEQIRSMNAWLKKLCAEKGYVYLDYYSAMTDDKGAMLPGYAKDGVHPTSKGYAVMGPLAEKAIAEAEGK